MIILSVETSCDETSVAILKDKQILSNVTISQVLEQQKYKGVLPSLATKLHLKNIQKVLKEALKKSNINIKQIDYISYTKTPGLVICLQIGKIIAETIALYLNKPLMPINHLEGHIYASLLNTDKTWIFPVLALVISGGHTQIYKLSDHNNLEILGETTDDAIGECLDKVGILLGYNYPAGPIIEKIAKTGKNTYQLTFPKNDKSCDFSFSGLKSEISRIINNNKNNININDLACSLQYILAKILVKKIKNALIIQPNTKTIVIGGGVIANEFLRNKLTNSINQQHFDISVFIPEKEYSTDNAAMIAICAYYKITKKDNLL